MLSILIAIRDIVVTLFWITYGVAVTTLRWVGILPPLVPPAPGAPVPTPRWRIALAAATGLTFVGILFGLLPLIVMIIGFRLGNQTAIQISLGVVFIGIWIAMLWRATVPAGGTHPVPGDGIAMLLQLIAFVAMMNFMFPSYGSSATLGKAIIGATYFGASMWLWGAVRGRRGHWGVNSLTTATVVLTACYLIALLFPQQLRWTAAAAESANRSTALSALVLEIANSKTIGHVVSETPIYEIKLDADGNQVGVPTVAQKDGKDWVMKAGEEFKTRSNKVDDFVVDGEVLIPIMLPTAYKNYVGVRKVYFIPAGATSLALAKPDSGDGILSGLFGAASAAGSATGSLTADRCQPTRTGDTITFPACYSGKWYRVGSGQMAITATGVIDHGGKTATPTGGSEMGICTQLDWAGLPDCLPLASLAVRVDNGRPFVVKNGTQINGGIVEVSINDTKSDDNSGNYVIQVGK